MASKLYVGGLSYDTTEDQLTEAFAKFGTVESTKVIMDRYSDRSKGFGFVEMSSNSEAQKAMQGLNGSVLDGRSIRVDHAQERPERGGGGGGGYGGRRY
ncbi:RNA recognition motif domain-containing protein [Chloroflexota bacterium]